LVRGADHADPGVEPGEVRAPSLLQDALDRSGEVRAGIGDRHQNRDEIPLRWHEIPYIARFLDGFW
jgi:hypothetical protein